MLGMVEQTEVCSTLAASLVGVAFRRRDLQRAKAKETATPGATEQSVAELERLELQVSATVQP